MEDYANTRVCQGWFWRSPLLPERQCVSPSPLPAKSEELAATLAELAATFSKSPATCSRAPPSDCICPVPAHHRGRADAVGTHGRRQAKTGFSVEEIRICARERTSDVGARTMPRGCRCRRCLGKFAPIRSKKSTYFLRGRPKSFLIS